MLKLFVAPNTCARVPASALEEAGIAFDTELIGLKLGQQNMPGFLGVNPNGKVPALVLDTEVLTENDAILGWINAQYPAAKLMPVAADLLSAFCHTADLSFFTATVHPIVTRVAMPFWFVSDAEFALSDVRPAGFEEAKGVMSMINTHLETGPWWYGENWSLLDVYLYWAWTPMAGVGLPQDAFPNIRRHCDLSNERRAVQRATAREAADIETLTSEGNYLEPH
jgi:glutathione S-transferase